ncbi:MAG: hypothetical protein R3284_01010, partial [Rubricoccaceae bacterium]|nr:hypothetical protein [Rubricoccaceae bacterium]
MGFRIGSVVVICMVSACASVPVADDSSASVAQDDLTGAYTNPHTIMHVGETDWEEANVRDTLSVVQ